VHVHGFGLILTTISTYTEIVMGLLRTAAVALFLACTAAGQTVQVSDFRCGRVAQVQLNDGIPKSIVWLTLRLQNNADYTPQVRHSFQRLDENGESQILFPLSATSPTSHWHLTVRHANGLRNFSVQHAAGSVLPANILPHHPASDSFDGTRLHPSWSLLHPTLMDYEVTAGALHLTPTQTGPSATWVSDIEDDRGTQSQFSTRKSQFSACRHRWRQRQLPDCGGRQNHLHL